MREAARGGGLRIEIAEVVFQYPPRLELGDLALAAPFDLAKKLKRKPREIAQTLAEKLGSLPGVARAEVAGGGYVNLFLERGAFALALHSSLARAGAAAKAPGRAIVEHTNINPNKAAHIGHLRNAVLGDTFVRAAAARAAYEVEVQNYIDDTGVQVADVVVGFLHLENEGAGRRRAPWPPARFDYYCWDLYAEVGDFYDARPRAAGAAGARRCTRSRPATTTRRELAAHVAARIVRPPPADHGRASASATTCSRTRATSCAAVLGARVRAAQGVGRGPPRERGQERRLLGAGHARASERAPDEDKIIVRSNGTVTYVGKDIAYQLWKFGLLGTRLPLPPFDCATPTATRFGRRPAATGERSAPRFGHARPSTT